MPDQQTTNIRCHDCSLPYDDSGWCDCVIPNEAWAQITPAEHPEGGILCLTCMARRLVERGLDRVPLLVTSGPFAHEPADA